MTELLSWLRRYKRIRGSLRLTSGQLYSHKKQKLKNALVAIVDDDVAVVRAAKRLLISRGIEATTFLSGTEFIDFIEQAPQPVLDCIILDVHMDGVNGLDVQRYLVENGMTIPIVFISSAVEPWIRDQAITAGAVAFFSKPFDPDAFIDSLEKLIASRRDGDAQLVSLK